MRNINKFEKEMEMVNRDLMILYEFGSDKQIESYEKLYEKLSTGLFIQTMSFYREEEIKMKLEMNNK